jgi:hypothetical protein
MKPKNTTIEDAPPISIVPIYRIHRPTYCTHLFTDFLHTGPGIGIDSFTRVNPRVCSECGAIEGTEDAKKLSRKPEGKTQ